jgi:simple sugar transport system ATP-binding protein
VDGNGQTELAQALTGLRRWSAGSIQIAGAPITELKPRDLQRRRIGYIPPDRRRDGLALSLSVADNLTLEAARLPQFRSGPFLKRRALRRFAEQTARDFDIRAESLNISAGALSGGNQQKILIARALWRKPKLLIAVSPTRGLDVAATAYVHARLRQCQTEGGAIVLISTELDEVVALSSRIAVLYEGRIAGIVPADTPRETLGLLMGGGPLKPVGGGPDA